MNRYHDQHAGHDVAMFRDRFLWSLALTVPTLIWGELLGVRPRGLRHRRLRVRRPRLPARRGTGAGGPAARDDDARPHEHEVVGDSEPFAVERLVTVLVIACPHALGLAIPLAACCSTPPSGRC